MKGYKRSLFVIIGLIVIYIIAEVNRPEELDWNPTLSSKDKNPFGAFILFSQLKDLFPSATIKTLHLPVYNQLNNFTSDNTAYVMIEPATVQLSSEDLDELLYYVESGNYVVIAATGLARNISDSLNIEIKDRLQVLLTGKSAINFTNPGLRTTSSYEYKRMPLQRYFSRIDTANAVILGTNQEKDANFIKVSHGAGAFFIHPLPLCFSNDFMLTGPNAEYTAKVLSYLPKNLETIFWDEYYKSGKSESQTPLRFILGNTWLRMAFRIGLVTMLIFVLFEMKRRQKIIPVIEPLKNTTLDFVKTVGNVYFNNRDNKNIAMKKITYFLEGLRSSFNLSTNSLDDEFMDAFAKKSAIPFEKVVELVRLISRLQYEPELTDRELLELNRQIDYFNTKIKE